MGSAKPIDRRSTSLLGPCLLIGSTVVLLSSVAGSRSLAAELGATERALLEQRGIAVTAGAAANYVTDAECARCHPAIGRSYRTLGMSRSFARPGGNGWVEDFDQPAFFHPPSARYYKMTRRESGLYFQRYQKDSEDETINELEQKVDWVLGSGSVSRSYLYRTPSGEIFQLPLAWYNQSQTWGMSPGYDRPDHEGVGRVVQRECLFCHNAYPEVAKGSDSHSRPQAFPADLPPGIGCQRCHGPGAAHVAAVLSGASPEQVADSIANPAKWSVDRQRDLCYQCHYQPSVAMNGLRRFERGVYSYRPGEPLDDYLVQVDVVEEGGAREDRFEINHHAYRLEQSSCFVESLGQIGCLSCHDPHVKGSQATERERARRACLGCHDLAADDAADDRAHDAPALAAHETSSDCVACHMPRRRSQDVVHAVMTDHSIRRLAAPEAWLEPLEESDPIIEDVVLLRPRLDSEWESIYRATAGLRAGKSSLADRLRRGVKRLEEDGRAPLELRYDLARAEIQLHRWDLAARDVDVILRESPDDPVAISWLALAEFQQRNLDSALRRLRALVEAGSELPEVHFNLGLIEAGQGRFEQAVVALAEATRLRPNQATAWFYLGGSLSRLGRDEEAAAALTRALEIDPATARAYGELATVLDRLERPEEARLYREHGRRESERASEIATP